VLDLFVAIAPRNDEHAYVRNNQRKPFTSMSKKLEQIFTAEDFQKRFDAAQSFYHWPLEYQPTAGADL